MRTEIGTTLVPEPIQKEHLMNTIFKSLIFLAVLAPFVTACGAQSAQAEPAEANSMSAASYQTVLGKSLNDKDVANFIAINNCSSVAQLQLCQSAGMALQMDSDQTVKSVFLYPGDDNSFAAYKGELPLGLTFTDTMATVEQKFGQPVEIHAPQAGWQPGLPDEGMTLDHIHYLAIYKRFGLTIVYNSPSANDKSATIHALLINRNCSIC
jgi:hypothetical protein